jgi:hypothetical protein
MAQGAVAVQEGEVAVKVMVGQEAGVGLVAVVVASELEKFSPLRTCQ